MNEVQLSNSIQVVLVSKNSKNLVLIPKVNDYFFMIIWWKSAISRTEFGAAGFKPVFKNLLRIDSLAHLNSFHAQESTQRAP